MFDVADLRIGVIGLGYVGLPLAVAFGNTCPTLGFDVSAARIDELKMGMDKTREVESGELTKAKYLRFSSDPCDLKEANFLIVTVPTPLNGHKAPDLGPLKRASELVGNVIGCGKIVVFESTVYPGATEEVCIPIIERVSGLKFNRDFYAGYSPERVNPGDKTHRVTNIVKITSGSTPEASDLVDKVYRQIVSVGTHPVSSIRVAEAAKVIENTQRDVNIALINELATLFERLGLDTHEVLEAAATKWNFLPFKPGLVGGHCIGVDPYYLTYKSLEVGHHPEMILAGRRINDEMGAYVAGRVIRLMIRKRIGIADSRVLVMGLAFKENCPDLRNTRVIDIVHELRTYGAMVDVWDPWVDAEAARREYSLELIETPRERIYDAIILAVGHEQFGRLGGGIRMFGKRGCIVYDVKGILPHEACDARL